MARVTTDNESGAVVRPAMGGLRFAWPYAAALLWVAADRASKIWVEQNLGPAESGKTQEWPLGIVLRFQENTGAAFSFLKGQPWVFTVIAIIVAIGMVVYYYRLREQGWARQGWLQLAFALILGGVVGNLIDRLTKSDGGVTDFVLVRWAHIGSWQFAVFNVADSGITIGVTLLVLAALLRALRAERTPAPVVAAPAETAALPIERPAPQADILPEPTADTVGENDD